MLRSQQNTLIQVRTICIQKSMKDFPEDKVPRTHFQPAICIHFSILYHKLFFYNPYYRSFVFHLSLKPSESGKSFPHVCNYY